LRHVFGLLFVYAVFALLAWRQVPSWPYIYDEADYMWASSLGWAANYTDTPTLPFREFLRLGLHGGTQKNEQQSLSAVVRNSNDIVFYRHWHGPVYFYWLDATQPLHSSEQLMRGLQLVFPAIGGLLIYLGCVSLLPAETAVAGAVLASAMYLWSDTVLRSLEIAPHQLFALWCLAALFFLAHVMITGKRRFWYGAVICCALAFCTMEVAFVPILTLLVCGHFRRRELQADWRFHLKWVVLLLGTILLVWPGGLLKLSAAKAYLFMAYLAVFRRHAWGSDLTITQSWLLRFAHDPVAWALVLAAVVVYLRVDKPLRASLVPFAVFSVLMIAAVFRVNADAPRYSLPFMPALDVFAAAVVAGLLGARKRAAVTVGVLCCGLFLTRALWLHTRPLGEATEARAILAWVAQNRLADKTLLIPQDYVPTVHYYFPRTTLTGYRDVASFADERLHGHFAAIYPAQP